MGNLLTYHKIRHGGEKRSHASFVFGKAPCLGFILILEAVVKVNFTLLKINKSFRK